MLISDLHNFLKSRFEKFPNDNVLSLEPCPAGQNGDFTINAFRAARFCNGPANAAQSIAEFFNSRPEVEKVEVVKAFVNLTMRPEFLLGETAGKLNELLESAKLPEEARRKILIEFSAPNTNKPQHLGHVRNNTIGMSLSSLLRRVGHTVYEINLVNDRGIHICKSMLAYKKFGSGETPESSGIKGDHLVGDYYVKFNTELSKELQALREVHPEYAEKTNDELFGETALGAEARQMLRDWEAGKPEVRELWQLMNSWVFAGFAETYKRMGIKFDHTYLESQTYLLGKDLVAKGLELGVFTKREDNAVICDLGKLGKKVVLRSDGTSVYITQDMGTTLLKHNDYEPDEMIWVVGDEQLLHFKMLFEIIGKLGYPWADKLYHQAYGMVNLPSGKMKSREGTVVDADDLFDEMVKLAVDSCRERADEGISEKVLEERGEAIGMGALKFMLLKFNPRTTMIFDPAASVKFEGDTGPYVQYAAARVNSIEKRFAEKNCSKVDVDWSKLNTPQEKELAVKLFFYPDILRSGAAKHDCSGLVEYLLDLTKSFNRFYRDCPILTAEPVLAAGRLALAKAVRSVITDGLNTLTIDVPEGM